MQIKGYDGVKVFSATKAQDRESIGETVTRWIAERSQVTPGFEIVDTVVKQSSDNSFHCYSIALFFRKGR